MQGFKKTVCIPEDAQMGQVFDIVTQYLESNPSKRHFDAKLIIEKALYDEYKCRN
jgi:hypothetical protein